MVAAHGVEGAGEAGGPGAETADTIKALAINLLNNRPVSWIQSVLMVNQLNSVKKIFFFKYFLFSFQQLVVIFCKIRILI